MTKEIPTPPDTESGWPWDKAVDTSADTGVDRKNWPKISIVTPSYNQGKFIEETIRSVLLQGYPNLEYIVVDGGSTDETVDILEKYDPWIDDWVSEPDDGQTHAINKGLHRATGDVHGWINSDDFFVRGALWRIAKGFASSECDVLSGGRLLVDAESNVTGWSIKPAFDPWKGGNTFPQDSTLWRSHVYEEVGYLDESYDFAMDFDFFLRLYTHFKIQDTNDLIGAFRCYSESKTHQQYQELGLEETRRAWENHLDAPSENLRKHRDPGFLRHWWFWLSYPRNLALPYLRYKLAGT
jgi:glycosyltransferase involved in cell wall biosynthesis